MSSGGDIDASLRRGGRFLLCIAGVVLAGIVASIAIDIVGRVVFATPVRGVTELVSIAIPTLVFLSLPELLFSNRLIRSEPLARLLARHAPRTAAHMNATFSVVGAVIALAIAMPTAAALWYAVASDEFLGVEGDFTVPVWPAKLSIVLGAGLLAIGALRAAERCGAARLGGYAGVLALGAALTGATFVVDDPAGTGILAIVLLFVLIYAGMAVAWALGLCALFGIAAIRDAPLVAVESLALAADSAVSEYVFAAVPLFVLMGLVVGAADIGRDSLYATHALLRRVVGGLGVATVAANAVFAAITGISIASAAIFSRVAVPPLIEHGFTPRFAVGLVAGSSVLGMLIPPSLLLIVYGLIAEVSINRLFLAAIVPGLLLATAFAGCVIAAATWKLRFAVDPERFVAHSDVPVAGSRVTQLGPVVILIGIVLGGIYGGIFTPTEAGAVGALAAGVIALVMRRLTPADLWRLTLDAAAGSASILLLIITATAFAIMLTLSGIPEQLSAAIAAAEFGLASYTLAYLVILVILGMVLDSTSILLIMVPLALPTVAYFGGDLVWFGVVSVIGVEIGLLTPPLGLSVYAIKASLEDGAIGLNDIFVGALPCALIMAFIAIVLIFNPSLARVW